MAVSRKIVCERLAHIIKLKKKQASQYISSDIKNKKYVNFIILENSLIIVFEYWLVYELSSDKVVYYL